jgi:hypothetical protein
MVSFFFSQIAYVRLGVLNCDIDKLIYGTMDISPIDSMLSLKIEQLKFWIFICCISRQKYGRPACGFMGIYLEYFAVSIHVSDSP